MTTVNGTTRAKSGRLRVKKRDKSGREYIGQNETIVSAGMFSSREMEKELQKAADEATEEVVGIEMDHYAPGEAPISAAPTRVDNETSAWAFSDGTATWPPRDAHTVNSRRAHG